MQPQNTTQPTFVTPKVRAANFKDMAGQVFGRLTVVSFFDIAPNGKKCIARWLCQCSCGKEVVVAGSNLRKGHTQSCGCYKVDRVVETHTTHGVTGSAEYHAWQKMIRRCTDKDDPGYKNYGGRGITVCQRWLNSSECFLKDMGLKPGVNYSLDRIDNSLGYSPENCKWSTRKEQNNNKRNNHFVEFQGERLTIAQWGDKLGIRPSILWKRIRRGWPTDKVLSP